MQPPVLMDSKVHCWTSLESQCARWQAPASLIKFEQRLIVDGLDLGARPVVSRRKAGLRRRPAPSLVGDAAVGLRLVARFRVLRSCSSDGDLGAQSSSSSYATPQQWTCCSPAGGMRGGYGAAAAARPHCLREPSEQCSRASACSPRML